MDTSYNNITDFQLIPYKPPPTLLLSPETSSVIEGYAPNSSGGLRPPTELVVGGVNAPLPKNDNTTNISTGGNDPTQTNSQLLSQITSNPSKQASTVPFTDGPLLKKLSVVGSISNALQIKFNYFSSSFTTFTVVAKPLASILSGPLAIVTQNIQISDTTGCTDITKNQHIYTITGLNQGTQYKLSLTAINYFKRQTTLIYPNVATNQPPDPPTNLQIASLTDYTADIMFTPPVQIIDTYIANVYSGSRFMFSERFEVPKGTRVKLPLTVSGLNFHVYYTITFFAVNSDGLSRGSTSITFETPQIPDAPTNLFSPSQTNVSIDLSFNPPLQYVQYYTLMAFDMSNIQVFNQNIDSHMNKYSVTGLITNRPYTIRVYSYNSDGISPTYTELIAETLPTLTSVSFGEITSTSIQFINLIGIYYQINVQRNIDSTIDGSFNISSTTVTYNDINLIPNTQYTYIFTPVNSFGIANVSFVLSPKYTYSSGFIRGCTNISSFYLQINFIGYYSSANIIRTGGTFIPGDTSSNFPNSNSPQTDVTAFVTDTSLKANTPYTYTVTIYNGDGVPNILSTNIGATTLCVVYNASFGIITNNSIQISDISGVYSKLTILRAGGITGYVSHDIINTTDTSYNDTGLFPNILYTYILIPYALNTNYNTSPPRRYYLPGVQYNSLGFGTYTRPILTNAAFSNTTYNSISLYQITGIFDRVHIVRTTQGISVPTATYDISSNVVSFTDISGLMPNSLNSYTLTSYNPNNLPGDIINLSVYTDASGYILPCIATGINTLKLQWTGYDSSVSIIRSGGGIFTPTLANNYPTSANPQSFVGGYVTDSGLVSNLPYTYNVTLYNGNSKPTVITTTIGNTTLPQITAASFGTITTTTQLIQGISGNYSTVVINQTNKTNSVTTNAVATISGNSTTISGLLSNNNYTYSLIPFNGLGVSGSTFPMTELYTLPSITSSSFGAFTATSLSLQNIVGSYKYIKVDRYTRGIVTPSYNIITVNSPDTSGVDLSLNPNTQYTYYLTPYNPNDTSGATYITSGKYTDVSVNVLLPSNVTSSSLQLNLYGIYSNVAISRDIVGGQFQTNYTSSSPQIINTSYVTDISVNTNTFYKYTFKFKNGDDLTNISDISQTVLTLPTITSVQYSGHSYNSLKVLLSGQYNTVRVYRVDVSNNTTIANPVNIIAYLDTSYNDIGLSPNYKYQYKCVPYNINDVSGTPVISTPKYTDASGKTMPFTNVTNFSTQINWMGYYSGIYINRYKDGLLSDITFGTPSLYTTPFTNITDPYAQSLLTGYAQDMNVIQNVTYIYKFVLYNGDGLSSELPAIYLTNLPSITSTPAFGIVTSTSINITNVNGICNSINVNRTDELGFTTVFNVPNITTIYDTSVNFASQIIPYDAKYTYSLTPFGITGASGDTVNVPGFIYTLPKLDSVSYGIVDASSIQFNVFTGSYEYIQVDRYFGDITQPQSNTLQKKNAFSIVKGQSIYNDIGLLTDVSYSYRFTPFNLSVPNVSGTDITLNVIYTKPYLQSAIYKTPTNISIPIDISSSICTSVTINRYKAGGQFDTSYDVPYTSTINDISFTNNVPYDVSYTYTLMPKNRVGTYGTPYSGLGTIYTLPLINSATFSTITSDTIAIIINASCTSITINRNDPNNINTISYDVSYAPIIYDTSMKFIGNIVPSSVIYNYILTPKNRVGLAGTPYNMPAQLYTLPVITRATFGTITSSSIPIYVTGTGKSITINRIDPNNTNTKSYDVSFASIIYDNSSNFTNQTIPYNVGYTYTLTPKNLNDASGYTYNVGEIYTLPSINSAQYKIPTYQTIPIDISSSVGLCTSVTVTRYLGGYIDTYGSNNAVFDVSYAFIINDVSINFTNQIIPYNKPYTYKLSPKNPNGDYGADISLSTIYTLPFITSAAYKTPTFQTIPIDIINSVGLCNRVTVTRKRGGVTDTFGIPVFDVSYAPIIYDVSGNFSGSVIPYDISYTYTLTPLNVVGVSGAVYNNLGTIYTLPSITSAQYKIPTYQTIPIDINSSVGLCTSVTVTRYLGGYVDTNGTATFDVSYATIINDVSVNFNNQIIPYNTAYTYKLSPKNRSGVYGTDIILSTIYTLPIIASAAYKTPTSQTIPIDIINSVGLCTNITVKRYRGGAVDTTGTPMFDVSYAPTIYDVSGNFSGSVIPYDISYTYTLTPLNAVGVSGTIYNNLGIIYSLPSITSASYGDISTNYIKITNIIGSYESINITRNVLDINNNIISSVTNPAQIPYPVISTTVITDSSGIQGLNANTKYSYTIYANNGSGQSAIFTMSGIYTLAQGSLGTITSTLTSNTMTWSGFYSRLTINRNIAGATFTGISNYPTSITPQSTVNGSAYDSTISSGSSNTYTIYLFNGSDVSINIGSFSSTPISNISATYGTITSSSIYLLGFTGSYTTIKVTRNIGIGYGVYDTSYTINYPDTSYNDTGLKPNTSYSYSLLPFNAVGVSGSYYNITPRNIYTLPNITNVAYSASGDTINFTSIDGSYSYVSFTRYQNNINKYSNNIFGATNYSDTGLTPDTSYSYQFVSYGSGSPAAVGTTVNVPASGVIYTLSQITAATFGIPTATQIPINVSSTCANITIRRYDLSNNTNISRDVSNAAIIYDNSVNFTNNTIPYDVSYVYTLTPKNNAGAVGESFNVGIIYTIPNITTASSSVIDVSSMQISVTGSFASIQVNRYNGSTLQSTNNIIKPFFPIIDTNLSIDTSYNYVLIPFNESVPGVSGSAFIIPEKYTYGNISSASLVNVNSSTLQIQSITGTYDGIYYTRTGGSSTINSTISTPVTVFSDPSMLIPDTSYTYVLSAINKDNISNTNSNATFSVSNYTDASGYITSVTDTSNSLTVYWSGYCNSGVLMYTNNTPVITRNNFTPVDGQLRDGSAVFGSALTPNNQYGYYIQFTNYNGRIFNSTFSFSYTLAYYSSATITADSSSSITVNWTGYYNSITPVYQNGALVTPDVSSNKISPTPQASTSGFIRKTGLSANTSYYYDISLNNDANVVTGIARQSVYTLAYGDSSAPTPIDVSTIRINWTGYDSSASVAFTTGTLSTINKSNYPSSGTPQAYITGYVYNTGLSSNTSYNYTVTLYNGNNVATSLTSQSIYTFPSAPTINSASNITATTCTIAFTEPGGTGVITYTLTRGTLGTKGTGTFPVTGLNDNSVNNLVLSAANISATSTAASFPVTTLPSAPSFSASAGTTGTTLSITKPSGTISSYGFSGGESSSVLGTPSTYTANCTATVNNLLQNTAYTFYLSAYNNTSLLRSASGSLAFTTNPTAPTSLSATDGLTSTTLSWTEPLGTINSRNVSGGGTVGTITAGSCPITNLTSNTAYTFSVTVTGLSGTASAAGTLNFQTNPNAITDLSAVSTATGATLTWTNPAGTISSFSANIGDLSYNNTTDSAANTGILTYSAGTAGTAYSLTITCTNSTTGKTSAASNSVSFTKTVVDMSLDANSSKTTSGIYTIITITGSSILTVGTAKTISYCLIGGGGSGGPIGNRSGGGGGAGGYVINNSYSLATGTFTATVGDGGAVASGSTGGTEAYGNAGGDTTMFSVTAIGGGYGGSNGTNTNTGGTGGSGGGNWHGVVTSPSNATTGQGNNGGRGINSSPYFSGGGGGGAGGAGGAAGTGGGGAGGAGINITSTNLTGYNTTINVCCGGGGGSQNQNGGAGGKIGGTTYGGAGKSGTGNGSDASTTGYGHGGGGAGGNSGPYTGGKGSKGVIIIIYVT